MTFRMFSVILRSQASQDKALWKASWSRQKLLFGPREPEILEWFIHENILTLRQILLKFGRDMRVRGSSLIETPVGSRWCHSNATTVETEVLSRPERQEILEQGFRTLYESERVLALERFGVPIQVNFRSLFSTEWQSVHGTLFEVGCHDGGCEHLRASIPPAPVGRALTVNEFLSLRFSHSEKWHLRSSHIEALVPLETPFSSALTEIRKTLARLESQVSGARISKSAGLYPAIADLYLWESHDLFFVASAGAEFRHHVLPYRGTDLWLAFKQDRSLFSGSYYRSLPVMTDLEIADFLKYYPIEVTGRFVAGGRHRVSAMLGRLARGGDYIPIYVKELRRPINIRIRQRAIRIRQRVMRI